MFRRIPAFKPQNKRQTESEGHPFEFMEAHTCNASLLALLASNRSLVFFEFLMRTNLFL